MTSNISFFSDSRRFFLDVASKASISGLLRVTLNTMDSMACFHASEMVAYHGRFDGTKVRFPQPNARLIGITFDKGRDEVNDFLQELIHLFLDHDIGSVFSNDKRNTLKMFANGTMKIEKHLKKFHQLPI